MQVPQAAVHAAVLLAVRGVARIRNPLGDLGPAGVERIRVARLVIDRATADQIHLSPIGQACWCHEPAVGAHRVRRKHVPTLVQAGELKDPLGGVARAVRHERLR